MKRLLPLLFAVWPGLALAQSGTINAPLVPTATAAAASSLVVRAACDPVLKCTLFGFHANATAAGYVMVFDATAAPSDGTVTPIGCVQVATGGTTGVTYNPPLQATTGLVLAYSSTGCFTKTASATAYLSAQAR